MRIAVALAVMLVGTGCVPRRLHLEMTPRGDKVLRELSLWTDQPRADGGNEDAPDPAHLSRALPHYPAPSPSKGRVTLRAEFGERLPPDVGGWGRYATATCPLGSAFTYLERFGGGERRADHLEHCLWGADRIVEILDAWLVERFSAAVDESTRARLSTAVHGKLRDDLRDAVVVMSGDPRDVALEAFLHERGYAGLIAERQTPAPPGATDPVLVLLATVAGIEPESPSLAPLRFADEASAASAWTEFDARSPRVKEIWVERRTRRVRLGLPADDVPDQPIIGTLFVSDVVGMDTEFASGELTASLASGERPFSTDGEWDETWKAVRWKGLYLPSPHQPPVLRHAKWTVPSSEMQRSVLGATRLTGRRLHEYATWYAGLPPDVARRWDQALGTASPVVERRGQIEKVEVDGVDDAVIRPGRNLLLQAFEPEQR